MRIEHPRFADDVSLFVLDDTGIVFNEAAQRIYELNAAATYIWCRIEEGLTLPDLAAALAKTFDFAPRDAERHVQEALADWRSCGFLAGISGMPTPTGDMADGPRAVASDDSAHVIPAAKDARTRRYGVLGTVYRVFFASPEIETWVHPVLANLESSSARKSKDTNAILVWPESGGFLIAQKGGPVYPCTRPDEIAPLVRWVIFADAIGRAEQELAIHAGAVCDGGRALILPGRAGSGKTTLTGALVHAGLRYLSDDTVLLETEHSRVRGVPYSLCVKESGLRLLTDRFPALLGLAVHTRPDGKRVRYLPMVQDSRDRAPRVAWIVFPQYDPVGANALRPLRPSAALVELTRNSALIRTVTRAQVRDLVALIRRVPCFEIRVSSLEDTAKVLQGLWK